MFFIAIANLKFTTTRIEFDKMTCHIIKCLSLVKSLSSQNFILSTYVIILIVASMCSCTFAQEDNSISYDASDLYEISKEDWVDFNDIFTFDHIAKKNIKHVLVIEPDNDVDTTIRNDIEITEDTNNNNSEFCKPMETIDASDQMSCQLPELIPNKENDLRNSDPSKDTLIAADKRHESNDLESEKTKLKITELSNNFTKCQRKLTKTEAEFVCMRKWFYHLRIVFTKLADKFIEKTDGKMYDNHHFMLKSYLINPETITSLKNMDICKGSSYGKVEDFVDKLIYFIQLRNLDENYVLNYSIIIGSTVFILSVIVTFARSKSKFKYAFCTLLLAGFIWEYYYQYNEKLTEIKIQTTRRSSSETSKGFFSSLFGSIYYTFNWRQGDKEHETLYYHFQRNPWFEVNPLYVFTSLLFKMLSKPTRFISADVGVTLQNLFTRIPLLYSPLFIVAGVIIIYKLFEITLSKVMELIRINREFDLKERKLDSQLHIAHSLKMDALQIKDEFNRRMEVKKLLGAIQRSKSLSDLTNLSLY